MPVYLFERHGADGRRLHAERFYPLDEMPRYGQKVEFDGHEWVRIIERKAPTVRLEPATVAHSMPRRGMPTDPGAPRYDRRGRPVLLTSEEKATYAKKYEQHNRESCRFERTGSQGAFGDDE